jgi:hypothetical protein
MLWGKEEELGKEHSSWFSAHTYNCVCEEELLKSRDEIDFGQQYNFDIWQKKTLKHTDKILYEKCEWLRAV